MSVYVSCTVHRTDFPGRRHCYLSTICGYPRSTQGTSARVPIMPHVHERIVSSSYCFTHFFHTTRSYTVQTSDIRFSYRALKAYARFDNWMASIQYKYLIHTHRHIHIYAYRIYIDISTRAYTYPYRIFQTQEVLCSTQCWFDTTSEKYTSVTVFAFL